MDNEPIHLPNGLLWQNGEKNSQEAIDWIKSMFLNAETLRTEAIGENQHSSEEYGIYYKSIILVDNTLRMCTEVPYNVSGTFVLEIITQSELPE